MTNGRYTSHDYLMRAALIHFVLAFVHIVVPFDGIADYVYIGTNQYSFLEFQRSAMVEPAALVFAVIFSFIGMYCLSAAEMMRPLPGLDVVLWMAGGLYLLRSALFFLGMARGENLPAFNFVASVIALTLGLLILFGMRKRKLNKTP